MAISQILYGQYLGFIWDSYVLGLKTKVFCRKKTNAQNHRQGTYSAKMGAVVWPKILFAPIGIFKKKSLRMSVVRAKVHKKFYFRK